MAVRKRGQFFKFASERGGYPEREGSLRNRGVPTLEETMERKKKLVKTKNKLNIHKKISVSFYKMEHRNVLSKRCIQSRYVVV